MIQSITRTTAPVQTPASLQTVREAMRNSALLNAQEHQAERDILGESQRDIALLIIEVVEPAILRYGENNQVHPQLFRFKAQLEALLQGSIEPFLDQVRDDNNRIKAIFTQVQANQREADAVSNDIQASAERLRGRVLDLQTARLDAVDENTRRLGEQFERLQETQAALNRVVNDAEQVASRQKSAHLRLLEVIEDGKSVLGEIK